MRGVANKLEGKRFGKLVVLKRMGKANRGYVWRCVCDCGNIVDVQGSNLVAGHTRSCGCLRGHRSEATPRPSKASAKRFAGDDFSVWPWVRKKVGKGYIMAKCPWHPEANEKNKGWIAEHRLIVELSEGRLLTEDETVHHRNGDPSDNTPGNLEACIKGSNGHPTGSRTKDVVEDCARRLFQFAPEMLSKSTRAAYKTKRIKKVR